MFNTSRERGLLAAVELLQPISYHKAECKSAEQQSVKVCHPRDCSEAEIENEQPGVYRILIISGSLQGSGNPSISVQVFCSCFIGTKDLSGPSELSILTINQVKSAKITEVQR